MSSSSRLIVIFTAAFTILIVSPAFLSRPFFLYRLMTTGDAVDIITPLVLIPLYWLLYRLGKPLTTREMIVFLFFAAMWVGGQGIHLAANSIKHLMGPLHGTNPYILAEFYDEELGHYLWHIGLLGLTALLLWRQMANPLVSRLANVRIEAVCALIYGLVLCIIVIEGGTVPMGLPFSAVVAVVALARRKQWREQPITAFFGIAHALALILFVIWFSIWRSFPQFSDLGLI